MNPVWIIDDDRSIRWVLREGPRARGDPFKSFGSAAEALMRSTARAAAAGAGVRHPHAG
jgi:DNA-binding NtrC family response regulator